MPGLLRRPMSNRERAHVAGAMRFSKLAWPKTAAAFDQGQPPFDVTTEVAHRLDKIVPSMLERSLKCLL